MTRRLPWDRDAPARTPSKTKPTHSASSNKFATPQSRPSRAPETPTQRENSSRKPGYTDGFLREKSPSTSPPPEPIQETFMTEGIDNDDKYRMVEDELFTIAGQYTAHLHAAEYQRLKVQTRSQNAETIKNISRPVVGSLTELARKRQEELLRRKKQREALRRAKREAGRGDEESGDETVVPWRGTSLQGLMDSPMTKEVPLMALTKTDSGGRASSFFGGLVRPQSKRSAAVLKRKQDSETETDDDSDDLGGPAVAPARREAVRNQLGTAGSGHPLKTVPKAPARVITKQQTVFASDTRTEGTRRASHSRGIPTTMTAMPVSSASTTKKTAPSVSNDDNDDDDDELFTRFKNRRINARQERRGQGKKEEQPEQKKSQDMMPSFI